MLAATLVLGRKYAIRQEPRDRGPFIEATLIGPVRAGKAKVRWLDSELEGLEEWLTTRQIICPWGERKAFLRDEERSAVLKAASNEVDEVVQDAISEVMAATGESGGFMHVWSDLPERMRRLWTRARLEGDPLNEPRAYVDRHGRAHLSATSALRWAQAFAAAEPDVVGLYVKNEEDQLLAEGWQPGNRFSHDFLRQSRPAYALVRDWAAQPERHLLQNEVDRLRGLVEQAVQELRASGATAAARRVERALMGL